MEIPLANVGVICHVGNRDVAFSHVCRYNLVAVKHVKRGSEGKA